jgi:hypothetical protein
MHERIYVCHTYYHVYISCLKELWSGRPQNGEATMVLSKISTDFGDLKARLEKTGLFAEVYEFDEKRADFFPEVDKYRQNYGNRIRHMYNRLIFTKKLGKAQIPYLPVDFRRYQNIYVYCDLDPIGYYLNYAHIPYHAVEDGLNCFAYSDGPRFDNRGFFRLKTWLARRNLIFIEGGYSKYCLDMEVNDISALVYPGPKYIEQSRAELVNGLDEKAKELLLEIFVADMPALKEKLFPKGESAAPKILILTEVLGDFATRQRIFSDIIDQYGQPDNKPAQIIIKPHPRDTFDYQQGFSEHIILDRMFPMEILNFIAGLRFERVITVFTVPHAIKFAHEVIRLGEDFMDKYQDPSKHRRHEQIL